MTNKRRTPPRIWGSTNSNQLCPWVFSLSKTLLELQGPSFYPRLRVSTSWKTSIPSGPWSTCYSFWFQIKSLRWFTSTESRPCSSKVNKSFKSYLWTTMLSRFWTRLERAVKCWKLEGTTPREWRAHQDLETLVSSLKETFLFRSTVRRMQT